MKSATGTIQRTAQLRTVFIDIILLLLTKTDKHIKKLLFGGATELGSPSGGAVKNLRFLTEGVPLEKRPLVPFIVGHLSRPRLRSATLPIGEGKGVPAK